MKKQLFLIRHAEADSTNFDIRDIERPLTVDGEIMASKIGRYLKSKDVIPDGILVSSALRTRQTAGFLVEQIDYDAKDMLINEDLYEASTRILLSAINDITEDKNTVLIVAHNPAISYLAEYITGDIIGNVSPAGIVHISFEGNWSEISAKNTDLEGYVKTVELNS